MPQLKNAAAIYCGYNVQVDVTAANGSALKKFKEPKVFVAETQFFRMFNFPLAEGNMTTALSEPGNVLLTKEFASKYFGDWKTAMGKTLKVFGINLKITGILENPPSKHRFSTGCCFVL